MSHFLKFDVLPRKFPMLLNENKKDSSLEPLIKPLLSEQEAIDDDLKLATGLFVNVLVTTVSVILILISFVNFFTAEHVFSIISLSCFNIVFIGPLVILSESKIVQKLSISRENRRLSDETAVLKKEIHSKNVILKILNNKVEGLKDCEELLKPILSLKGERIESFLPIANDFNTVSNQLINAKKREAVEVLLSIVISYYKPLKLGLTVKEVDEVIFRIKTDIKSITLNEIGFRKLLRRYGDTFGGIFNVIQDILNGSYSASDILLVKNSPDLFETYQPHASEEVKEDDKKQFFNERYEVLLSQ